MLKHACTHLLQEKESLTQASELLQKLGYKGNILEDTSHKEDA